MSAIINHTKKWLESFVIHYNLCPFAKREFLANAIRYEVFDGAKKRQFLEKLVDEFHRLDADTTIETTLLILPDVSADFFRYLDYYDLAQLLLEEEGYEGIYQIASFHPEYVFAEVDLDAAENYTNRSPYPMIHILREASMEKAIKAHPSPEDIPARNIALLENLGKEYCKAFREKIMEEN